MNVAVTLEHRFHRTPDGAVWTDGLNACRFWTRYLSVFDGVKVVARVRDVAAVPAGWIRADGAGVTFCAVPDYLGQAQFFRNALRIRRAIRRAVADDDAVILRVSSHIAGCLEPLLVRRGHPYGLEVINDPLDVFSKGAVRLAFRPFLRWWFVRQLRRQCLRSVATAYVTGNALQRRYPSPRYSAGISDVELPEDALVSEARTFHPRGPFRLVMVGSLAQMYKAPDVLIRAVAGCVRGGLDISLRILGDGQHQPDLERLASTLAIADRVRFLGRVPAGAAVRAELDQADLFVLPSRHEGLPRALVEAMARALPCIGSTVGGIPELLAPEDLVPPGDAPALAAAIRAVLASPARMALMSARNLARAREYRDCLLESRRVVFFQKVRQATAAWLHQSAQPGTLAEIPSAGR